MRRSLIGVLLAVCAIASQAQGQQLTVFAAASLKESANQVARDFERLHPGVSVILNFGGSQQLAAQIKAGAPADVFLSAGMEPLKTVRYLPSSLSIYAQNRLALIVPAGSQRVKGLGDLAGHVRIVIADGKVPVGHYTLELIAKLQRHYGRIWVSRFYHNVASREQDVRAVLAKVELGEADAGIVYTTDAASAKGKVRVLPVPVIYNVVARYPGVRFADSPSASLAKSFMDYLLSARGQSILASFGFSSPLVRRLAK